MSVGTIIFPVRVEEQFFFQYGLQFLETFKWKSLSELILLSSTKIEVMKVERLSLPEPGIEPGTSGLPSGDLTSRPERICYETQTP
jgi:hypothetical protein